MENQVGFGYLMPDGNSLYIVSSREIGEDEDYIYTEFDDDDLHFKIVWDKKICPFRFNSQIKAMCAAIAAQWGANNV